MSMKEHLASLVAAANVITAVCASAFVALALAMLGQQLFWMLLGRTIYSIARHGLVRRRKLLATVGAALVGFAIPGVDSLLKKVVHALGG